MNNNTIYKVYLRQGTAGYAVVGKFYFRYADLLARISLTSIDDVVHEIYLSLSKINFEEVRNPEHYLMRAIKLQCWTLLDKAIRMKEIIAESVRTENADETENRESRMVQVAEGAEHLVELEGMELLVNINLFKTRLNPKERELLNFLINETERSDIAKVLELNMNTLDTNIRRLRIKLADFLKGLGYSYTALEKFS